MLWGPQDGVAWCTTLLYFFLCFFVFPIWSPARSARWRQSVTELCVLRIGRASRVAGALSILW